MKVQLDNWDMGQALACLVVREPTTTNANNKATVNFIFLSFLNKFILSFKYNTLNQLQLHIYTQIFVKVFALFLLAITNRNIRMIIMIIILLLDFESKLVTKWIIF